MNPIFAAFASAGLSTAALFGCVSTNANLTKAETDAQALVHKGALFCAKAQGVDGTLVVMLANAAGVPVSVINQSQQAVATACAIINAIPVTPPPNPAQTPVVATTTTLPTVKS